MADRVGRRTAARLLPVGSRRRQSVKRVRQTLRKSKVLTRLYRKTKQLKVQKATNSAMTYETWVQELEPTLWVRPKRYKQTPLISIIVPAFNTPDKYIRPLLESIQRQSYEHWELCMADGSTNNERAQHIADLCRQDTRIVYKRLEHNHGIVGNSNAAIALASGEFIGFLDHDDTLAENALLEVIDLIDRRPEADIIYSDEDKISDDGQQRSLPFFKPDWSPALEEAVNYMTHFLVVRRTIIDQVGVLRDGFEGAQDYDFILRITDHSKQIYHIPKVLYHWRLADGSTSGPIENKDYATKAGLRALKEHVERQNIAASVLEIPELPTNYRLKYDIPNKAKASIIIPFKDKADLLKACVGSILEKTAYPSYEIILLSNNSVEPETTAYLETLRNNQQVTVHIWDNPFNYSMLNNFGRHQATGDFLIFLNNDTEVINSEWLGELLGVAAQPGVGAVGPLLYYPTNKIQHAGIVLGMHTMAGHVFRLLPDDAISPFGRPYWPRNYLAVTGACLAIQTSKYDAVGGFDETFVMAGNDVALGISLHEKGYLNVYWPFAKLYHYENVSVGSYQKAPPGDYDHSLTYYKPYLHWGDPYFNVNLDLMVEQIGIRGTYGE